MPTGWDGVGWQRMNLGWRLTLGHHKVRRRSGAGAGWGQAQQACLLIIRECGLCGDDICVMCDREEVENVLHSARRPPLVSESGLNNFSLLEMHLVPLLVFFPLHTHPVVLLARLWRVWPHSYEERFPYNCKPLQGLNLFPQVLIIAFFHFCLPLPSSLVLFCDRIFSL